MNTDKPHLDEGCPGKEYFDRKQIEDAKAFREMITEAMGDVPKYMKIAGENRMWLVWLSAGIMVFGTLLIAHLT